MDRPPTPTRRALVPAPAPHRQRTTPTSAPAATLAARTHDRALTGTTACHAAAGSAHEAREPPLPAAVARLRGEGAVGAQAVDEEGAEGVVVREDGCRR